MKYYYVIKNANSSALKNIATDRITIFEII